MAPFMSTLLLTTSWFLGFCFVRGKAFADATVGCRMLWQTFSFSCSPICHFNLGLWLYLCFNVASCALSFL
jgi:hypothetical protein